MILRLFDSQFPSPQTRKRTPRFSPPRRFPILRLVKPRTKFLIGGALVIGTAGYLAASAIKDTGVYYLTPGELSAKTKSDPTFYETGVKVGARVVNGSIIREPGGRQVAFKMTDGAQTYDVVYRGITPDTFTDGVDVVVEGRLGRDNNFRETTLLANCA